MIIMPSDLKTLYEMEGETLTGIIYEDEDLILVLDKHTINIRGSGSVSVQDRSCKAGER